MPTAVSRSSRIQDADDWDGSPVAGAVLIYDASLGKFVQVSGISWDVVAKQLSIGSDGVVSAVNIEYTGDGESAIDISGGHLHMSGGRSCLTTDGGFESFGLGTMEEQGSSNTESVRLSWDVDAGAFLLQSKKSGTGTYRPIRLLVEGGGLAVTKGLVTVSGAAGVTSVFVVKDPDDAIIFRVDADGSIYGSGGSGGALAYVDVANTFTEAQTFTGASPVRVGGGGNYGNVIFRHTDGTQDGYVGRATPSNRHIYLQADNGHLYLGASGGTDSAVRLEHSEIPSLISRGLNRGIGINHDPTDQSGPMLTVVPYTAAKVVLALRGATSQTANLQEWRNSSGTVLASMSAAGIVTASGYVSLDSSSSFRYLALGISASVSPFGGTAVGGYASASHDSVAVGSNASASATLAVAIGGGSNYGGVTTASGTGSIAIGWNARATATDSVAIGDGVQTAVAGQFKITNNVLITAYSLAGIPLTVKGVASQTANLQEWQNSSATVLSSVKASGIVTTYLGSGATASASEAFRMEFGTGGGYAHSIRTSHDGGATNVNQMMLSVATGISTQINVLSLTGLGRVGVNSTDPEAAFHVNSLAAATKGVIVRAATSQSANLQEWQNSGGTVLSSITKDGVVVIPDGTVAATGLRFGSMSASNGIFVVGNTAFGFAQNGVNYVVVGNGTVLANTSQYYWSSSSSASGSVDTGLVRSAAGVVNVTTGGASLGSLIVGQATTGTVGLTVRQVTSGTANLQEWQNSSGTILTRVDASGRVGIGATPDIALKVTDGTTSVPLVLTDANYSYAFGWGLTQGSAYAASAHFQFYGNGGRLVISSTAGLTLSSTSTSVIAVTISGSSTTEITALHLGNTSFTANTLTTLSFGAAGAFAAIKHKLYSGGTSSELQFHTTNSGTSGQRAVIDNSGKMGLGEASPTAQLHVVLAAAGTIGQIIKGATSQSANLQEWQNSSGNLAGDIYLGTSGGVISVRRYASSSYYVGMSGGDGTGSSAYPYIGWSNVSNSGRLDVGALNAYGFNLYAAGTGRGTTGLWFGVSATGTAQGATNSILPSGTTGVQDGVIILGGAAARFANVYSVLGNFIGAAAGSVVLTVKGATSQSANLQEWQDSAGTALAYTTAAGVVTGTGMVSLAAITVGPFTGVSHTGEARLFRSAAASAGGLVVQLGGASDQNFRIVDRAWNNTLFAVENNGVSSLISTATNVAGNWALSLTTAFYRGLRLTTTHANGTVWISGNGTSTGGLVINSYGGASDITFNTGDPEATTTTLFKLSPTTQTGLLTCYGAAISGLVVKGATSQSANLQEWQNSAGTALVYITAAGKPTSAGATTNQGEIFGFGSSSTGNYSAAFGRNATASGHDSVAIGGGAIASIERSIAIGGGINYGSPATASAQGAIAIGYATVASAQGAVALGWFSSATHVNSVAIRAATTATNQLSIGLSVLVNQIVSTTGSPIAFTLNGAAHTTLTASTEANDIYFNLARTVQWATGALTTQRAVYINAPTYGFVGASTITEAATFAISGAPIAGTNATITNKYALWVASGHTRLGGDLMVTYDGAGLGNGPYVIIRNAGAAPGNGSTSYNLAFLTLQAGIANVLGQICTSYSSGSSGWLHESALSIATNTNHPILFGTGATTVERMRIGSDGAVRVSGFTAAVVGLTVKGATSQSANLQEWQNSSGTALLQVNASGQIIVGTSATGVAPSIRNPDAVANYSNLVFYPSSGTNVNQSFSVIPRGTGVAGSRAQFTVFNTDLIADGTNYEFFTFRATGTGFDLFSSKSGTGTVRPINIQTSTSGGSVAGSGLTIDILNNVGVNAAGPGAQFHVVSSAAGTIGQIIKGATSQSANLTEWQNSSSTAFVTVGPPTLPGNSASVNFLNVTGTLPSSHTVAVNGVRFAITTAASSGVTPVTGLDVSLLPGYVAAGSVSAITASCTVAGTKTGLLGGDGNAAFTGSCISTTTGYNYGAYTQASGGNLNVGNIGKSVTAKNSATNIGMAGFALNTGSSPIQVGGYFGLQSADPTFASAALMCDNGSTTSDIFVARDNGVAVLTVADGGTATFGGAIIPASLADAAAPNGSLYYSTDAGKLVFKDSGGVVNNLY